MSERSVSVVVPVYNSAATLDELGSRLAATLGALGCAYEIVLVNDGSPDDSWAGIEALAARYPHVRGIDLTRNYGQHNAVLAGVRAARGDVIVTLDDDLQHPPEEIPLLLGALETGVDLVYGTPVRQQHSWWRNAAAVTYKSLLRHASGWRAASRVTDFRAFRTSLRDSFAEYAAPGAAFDALLAWTTSAIAYVDVEHAPRRVGRSNYRIGMLIEYAATMATTYSVRPLRLVMVGGVLLTFAGVLSTIIVLVKEIVSDHHVPGLALVLAVVILLAGIQLMAIGVVGEYVARAHQRLLAKPTYRVRTTIGSDGALEGR